MSGKLCTFEYKALNRGDPELVHNHQMTEKYQVRNPNLQDLHGETTSLRNYGFKSFASHHVPRAYNRGANLGEGQYEVDYE